VRCFIDDALKSGEREDWLEARRCFSSLFAFVRSHEYGRRAHLNTPTDILDVIKAFSSDPRIEGRYRHHQLGTRGISRHIEPCLPSHADRPPTGPGWLHEIKHDGFRGRRRHELRLHNISTMHGHRARTWQQLPTEYAICTSTRTASADKCSKALSLLA
jgi:hypothetical protein